MNKSTLKAEKRTMSGRKVKKLRQGGVVPANVFGKKIKSQAVQVSSGEFKKVYKEVGETGLLELLIDKDKKPVLIHNVQLDPVSEQILHVDFLQVNLKEKVTAEIPVEFVGESPAEKQSLGTIVQYINEVEVEALPTDLPEKFEIDLAVFTEVDQFMQLKDLKIDKTKVVIKDDLEKIIVKLEPIKEEKEEVPATEVPAEGEVAGETGAESKEQGTEEEVNKEVSDENTSK